MSPLCEGSPSKAMSPVVAVAEELSSGCTAAGRSRAESAGGSHFPSFVIAIGTTSNFFRSILSMIARAERMEISCSPDRPPKITPTRSFLGTSWSNLLQNCLAQRRQDEFDTQLGRLVIDVERGIYLYDFQ